MDLAQQQEQIQELYSEGLLIQSNYAVNPGLVRDEDWRVECVHFLLAAAENFQLPHEVVFIGINLIDRYMSVVDISEDSDAMEHLMLAAFWVVSKFEGGNTIAIDSLRDTAEYYDFSDAQLIAAEASLVTNLNGFLATPTEFFYLDMLCEAVGASAPFIQFARYLCFMALYDVSLSEISPADMASAAFALSRHYFDLDLWPDTIQAITNQNVNQHRDVMERLNAKMVHVDHPSFILINQIYGTEEYENAASHEYRQFPAVQ